MRLEQTHVVSVSQRWQIRTASEEDFEAWGSMRLALWPDEHGVATAEEMQAWLADSGKTALLALDVEGNAIGFAELALRHDYVNGTETSPVGFLEGWYVAPEWHARGVGRALIAAGEDWARLQGCSEFASDALLDNADSHAAHLACGFEETERVVYFRKSL